MTEWKLVPVEPTPEMVEAVKHADIDLVRDGFAAAVRNLHAALLAAAPSPAWVYDMFPTGGDADENACVWFYTGGRVVLARWERVTLSATRDTCWMPKPRQQPPEPPEGE